ncbi:hypothetical protein BDZ89DRAFT_1107651 [Hymenopellis radicata]|nr:hypothetical protein BDZ89DRAFT_1107651 [Hymenopellis radicata]
MDSADKKTPDLLPSHYQELPSEASGRHSDSRRRKIFRKITLALCSIILLGLLARHLTFVQRQYAAYMGGAKRWEWPIPSDLTVKECPELIPSDFREIGKTSVHFALPVSSKSLFLISRGSFSVGGVYFSQSDEVSDDVKVEIDIGYNEYHDDLDLVKVCSVSRRDGQNGVRIFVHVIFPKSSSGSLRIPNLDVEMPVFSHHIGDLSSVVFDYFGIKTAALTAHIAKLSDANGAITGHFNTSTYLELETANGVIDVSVDVYNFDQGKASVLKMKTANAFYVSAQTSVGSVKLDFPEAPVDSALSVEAETAMGQVDIWLEDRHGSDGA